MKTRNHDIVSIGVAWFMGVIFLLLAGCSTGLRPESIKILSTNPISGTMISSYPSIHTLYESDKEIALTAGWGRNLKEGIYKMRWEIYDNKGEMVYTTGDEMVDIREYLFRSRWLQLTDRMRDRFQKGPNTLMLLIENEIVASMPFTYEPISIVNKDIPGAVILPMGFRQLGIYGSFPPEAKKMYSNTLGAILFSEVKRIIPKTIPPYVAEERIRKELGPECFKDEKCAEELENAFSKVLFITGVIELSNMVSEPLGVSLFVYDASKGVTEEFHQLSSARMGTFSSQFLEIFYGILYSQGFLEYLKGL